MSNEHKAAVVAAVAKMQTAVNAMMAAGDTRDTLQAEIETLLVELDQAGFTCRRGYEVPPAA